MTPERPAMGVHQLRRMRTWFPLVRSIGIPFLSNIFITSSEALLQKYAVRTVVLYQCTLMQFDVLNANVWYRER